MWIVIRLLIAVAAFVIRFFWRASRPTPTGEFEGTPYFEQLHRSKNKRITGFQIGLPLRAPVIFRLQEERGSDRWFKRLGLAQELQTGDEAFDQKVYVACDHPALHQALRQSAKARELIREALEQGFHRISGDGEVLWLERSADRAPTADELRLLIALRGAVSDLESRLVGYSDPFAIKTVVIEAVTWSIFAYGVSAFFGLIQPLKWQYFDKQRLFGLGSLTAVILFALLFAAIAALLKGSSRGHRILIESVFLLAIGLPLTGTMIVSDLNQNVGTPEKVVMTREILRTDRVTHRKRNKKVSHSYYAIFAPVVESPEVSVPEKIRVTKDFYDRAAAGAEVELRIAKGWLGIPWLENVELR